MTIDVNIDYAADDSCQIQLWARGNHEDTEFIKACEQKLKHWDGREIDLSDKSVKHTYQRTVKADADTTAIWVTDGYVRIESAPGRGAYEITCLDEWLPLFTED
jgi:hypothetical protein